MPMMARGHYRRELAAWLFIPAMMGTIEGSVIGVLVKCAYEGVVSPGALNAVVAVLAGAPAFANVTSFVWSAASHGRNKVRFLVCMQLLAAVMIALIAFAPMSATGLWIMCIGAAGGRVAWSGVVTVRSTVWRMNYPSTDRARLAGKLATVQAVILLATGLLIGAVSEQHPQAFRVIYPAAALLGLVGIWIYSGTRVRGHRALLAAESAHRSSASLVSPMVLLEVLRDDRRFRNYMLCMFVFGSGNLMVAAPLVVVLRERFMLGTLQGILVTFAVSMVFMLASIPLWSRFLDRVHIVQFRAVHSWAFASSIAAFLLGAVSGQLWLMYLGAAGKGLAFGGGVLAWNLGHHDFAPPHRAGQYMGVHVTLTGIRGLFAPAAGIGIYEFLNSVSEGAGVWVFAFCLGLSLIGVAWFVLMARSWRTPERSSADWGHQRPGASEAIADGGDPLAPEEGSRVR